ncbi:MAG: multicopper oxidase family protein [Phreatobacter sp.]
MSVSRRGLFAAAGAGLALVGTSQVSGLAQTASLPEAPTMTKANTQAPLAPPSSGPDYQPVVTLNGWTLPSRMNGEWKEFHLVAEPVVREISPGMLAHLWGYNGQSPGPTIEAVEGDKLRIFVTNRLPESTAVHWHGQILPSGMDGVGGLTQPHIPPGKTFVYEFQLRKSGTFMYHSHSDEMVQMAMGMMGFFVVHPRDPALHRVDRDFVFLLNTFDIDPGTYVPKVSTMTDFNIWCMNSRTWPGLDPLVAAKNDRVRVRIGNLSMTNHPIHMHGYDFEVTCTDGGWVRPEARWPEVTIDVPVGSMRAYEFHAVHEGDWAFHCHKSHHTMGPMGHDTRTMIGVDQRQVSRAIRGLVPGFMPMGGAGMGEMGAMEMPIPANTLPMMTGDGPFGPVEMGGMFTVMKVREGLAAGDYKDPGWYQHPPGTVAYEWKGPPLARPVRAGTPPGPAPAARVLDRAARRARGGGHSNH